MALPALTKRAAWDALAEGGCVWPAAQSSAVSVPVKASPCTALLQRIEPSLPLTAVT